MSYQDKLSDNLVRVQRAMKEMDDFGNIGASPLLDTARKIYSELEGLEEAIKQKIREEE